MAAMTDRTDFPLFTIGFRPFFLLGACWSAIALAIWVAAFLTGRALPTALPAVAWHIHEMFFGFVLAAIAGFILIAVANWTGRPPIAGGRLAALVILWGAGRVLNLFSTLASFWTVTVIDVAFPVTLALLVMREITIARSWRNLMMPLPIVLLAMGDLLMYLEPAGEPVPVGLGWRLALAAVITLISVVGARIVPAFTRNWLVARQRATLPLSDMRLDRIASATLHTGLLGWALFPAIWPFGILLLLGTALNFVRLVGWKGCG